MKKRRWVKRTVLEELVLHYNTMDYLYGERSLHVREGGKVWRPIAELENVESKEGREA